jgi:hypothetical protein
VFNLPVENHPYYQIGDYTRESLYTKSASIQATWYRTTNQVTLSADKAVPNLLVTGLSGGDLYGGQFISRITVDSSSRAFPVDQALRQ